MSARVVLWWDDRVRFLCAAWVLTLSAACSGRYVAGETAPAPTDDCGDDSACVEACAEGDVQSCVVLGHSLEAEGDLDGAADAFERGCEQGSSEACAQQVRALRLTGRDGEAERLLAEVCAVEAGAERCRRLVGRLAEPGEREEAEPMLGARCDAGDAVSCRDLGLSFAERGRRDRAAEALGRACAAGDLESCLALERTLRELGRARDAVRAAERARALGAED